MSKVLDALRTSEAASQPEKATDQNARRLYTQECTKWVGAVSLILRKSFEQRETIDKTDVDAVVTKTQVPGSAGEQEKLQVKVVSWCRLPARTWPRCYALRSHSLPPMRPNPSSSRSSNR